MPLPQNTTLGNLELRQTYIYYDQPLLFLCQNTEGVYYIGMLVEEDDLFEKWCYVAVSPERLRQTEAGETELRNVFLEAEDGVAYMVNMYPQYATPYQIVALRSDKLLDSELPSVGITLYAKDLV